MFRDVPECSGMFHVPGFIDGLSKLRYSQQYFSRIDVFAGFSKSSKNFVLTETIHAVTVVRR